MADLDDITGRILEEYLQDVKDEIFASQNSLGITASGHSEQSTVITSGMSGRAFLSAPLYLTTNYDSVGRSPGKRPPIEAIESWIRAKSIQIRDSRGRFMSIRRGAFVIARSIGAQGTHIFRNISPGIPIKDILRDNLPPAGRRLAKLYANEMINSINAAIKR